MAKKTPVMKRSRRASGTTQLKTEAIQRLEKLATDLADVTAEATAVAAIVREGLEAEESNHADSRAPKDRKAKQSTS